MLESENDFFKRVDNILTWVPDVQMSHKSVWRKSCVTGPTRSDRGRISVGVQRSRDQRCPYGIRQISDGEGQRWEFEP
ncbi:hypothetical protein Mapa_001654 [Marchantia paleacea]|nr:hypothetical protein Mapa_001654 [Marchantia paleacea]